MTLKLLKLELSNIRSHDYFVFEPASEGITAISGPTGAGKSTIVDSIAWALYGTKPAGVSKTSAILKAGKEIGKDKCFARVTLLVDDVELLVERRMINKAGGVECEVFEKAPGDVEFTRVAGAAASHAGKAIRRRLKMDEKGFLATVLVQQKQVDQLISAGPQDRAEVIEKLTGISSITASLHKSRQESKALAKAATLSQVDEENLKKLEKEKAKLSLDAKKIKRSLQLITDKNEKIKEEGLGLRALYEEDSKILKKSQEALKRIENNNTKLEMYEKSLAGLIKEKEAKKKRLKSGKVVENLDKVTNDLSNERDKYTKYSVMQSKAIDAEKELNAVNCGLTDEINSSVYSDVEAARAAQTAVTERLDALEQLNNDLKATNAQLKADSKKNRDAIKIIENENGSCPTCLQSVHDIDSAVNALLKTIKENDAQLKINVKEIKTNDIKMKELQEEIDSINKYIKNVAEIKNNSEKIKELIQQQTNCASEIVILKSNISTLEKMYSDAKQYDSIKKEYDEILKKTQETISEINDLKKDNALCENELKGLKKVNEKAVETLHKKLEKARNDYNNSKNKKIELRGEYKLVIERLNNVTKDIDREKESLAKHKTLLKSVEVSSASTEIINEFRIERIKNSIPVIEVYASELLSRFTEGQFTGLKLDQKFNATVMLSDGTKRAVGLLSGGELSAASMALRLAISLLLNAGASQSLIILDEVLVSQDANRAEIILSAVKELCKGQVVLIAHNGSIDGIADTVIQL